MRNELQRIRVAMHKATSKYRKLNIVFGIISALGTAITMINFIEKSEMVNKALYNATSRYGSYERIDTNFLGFIVFIASAFFYFCLCALINLLIDIYGQSYAANELKIYELEQLEKKEGK
ncbi:hypothetical protein NHG29_09035 [Aerococcaceae bacterium NML160702]|nr:hypothetical protein [Aerococcaceae bacterium NML160702]